MTDQPAGAPGTCSARSLELHEPLAGSASEAAGFLLLEHGGPWGARSLEDDTLATGLGVHLRTVCAASGLTALLVRRPGAAPGPPERPTVVVAVPDGPGTAVSRLLASWDDLMTVDVPQVTTAARAGTALPGWDVVPHLLAVCTNGRRDVCCAIAGRAVAARLSELQPGRVWESSHLGGHRWAANVLALPSGLVYGRVPAQWAEHVLHAVAEGRVLVPLIRGRSALAPAVQVAEVALREHTDEDLDESLRLLDWAAADLEATVVRTTSHWEVSGGTWRVVVDTEPGPWPPRPISCGAEPTTGAPAHTVVEVAETGSAGRGAAGWDAAHRTDVGDPHPLVVREVTGLAPGTALDIASGTGRHSLWLAENGWQVTAVDFSRTGLAVAAREAATRGVDVDWQLADARLWTPPHDGYDLVLMTYVHLPAVLRRALRWLRPGGHVVIVGHALRNATEGVGGPSNRLLLHDVVDLAARVTGARLRVLRATEVERPVEGGTVVDALVVATRLPSAAGSGSDARARQA